MPRHATDLSDKSKFPPGTFGFLQPISQTGKKKFGSVEWNCLCDCGQPHVVPANGLTRKSTTSCGKCGLAKRGGDVKARAARKAESLAEQIKTDIAPHIPKQSALAKALNVRETKRELQPDPELRKYENKPLTGMYRKKRKLTVNERGIEEARCLGAGRWNLWIV